MSDNNEFGINKPTADTLDYYLGLEKPQFAVLINSKWGSGKTWFIRQYIKSKEKTDVEREIDNSQEKWTFCYVSLFAIEKIKELDNAIFLRRSPKLAKFSKRFGRLAGFAFEKIAPLLDIGDAKVNAKELQEAVQESFITIPKNLVFVMDDIERSKLSINLILGYISNLLDEHDAKVIVLCDETKIREEDETRTIFGEFREKVVGITTSVYPDIEAVFGNAISEVRSEYRPIFVENRKIIFRVLELSNTDNLRHLKRIVYSISRFLDAMTGKMIGNKEYIAKIVEIVSVLSVELDDGARDCDFVKVLQVIYKKYNSSTERKGTQKESVENVFSEMLAFGHYFDMPHEILKEFFFYGKLSSNKLVDHFTTSYYNTDKDHLELPLRVWHYSSMQEDKLLELYYKMREEVKSRKYNNAAIILHAYGIMLRFVDFGVESLGKTEIIQDAKDYFGNLAFNDISKKLFECGDMHPYSLSFMSNTTQEFQEIYNYAKEVVTPKTKEHLVNLLENICDKLPYDVDYFIENFPYGGYQQKFDEFYLFEIDFKKLASNILKLHNPDINRVMPCIYQFIGYHNRFEKLSGEKLDWVESFFAELRQLSKEEHLLKKANIESWLNPESRSFCK